MPHHVTQRGKAHTAAESRAMIGWKKAVLLNIAAVIGAASTIFIAPPTMSIWVWAAICVSAVAFFNLLLFRKRRNPSQPKSNTTRDTLIGLAGLLFLLLQLYIGYLLRKGSAAR